ncbi:MAG TPA: cbb3-type cytochrome c oxidase subunit I [Euzebyales bacterium]|nr:cbb3-type cytochrome c oxidase subunit I [Euzebyales bacterium]
MAAQAPPAEQFRTCTVTEFRVERSGANLALANAVAAVVLLAAGGLMALLIALQRQGIVPLSNDWWYRLVSAHGATMLLFWLLFFEVAALYWGSTMLLNARMRAPRVAWGVFGLMVAGVALVQWTTFTGRSTVMFTAYPPLEASPLYYLGVLMFAVGVLLACGLFFANVIGAGRERTYDGSLPLVVYGLATAAIIAVYSLLTGAVAYGLVFLRSLGVIETVDPAVYRMFFWGIGHGAQQVNLAAMVAVWYALIALTTGGRTISESLSRVAFLLLLAFIHLGAVHHLLVDPGLGTSHRLMNTSYLLYLAVLASLIHAFCIPSAIEVAQRERGFGRGLFTWLIRAPWKEPGFSALVLSISFFGFVAGVTGVLMSTMHLNMLIHNTLFVPGHFHATVVSGTTLAFMGIAYYLVPILSRRSLVGVGVARLQPYVFGGGVALLSLAMIRAGQLGVPRRVADLGYEGTVLPVDTFQQPQAELSMLLVTVGAVLAVIGGAMFIYVMVATLLTGKISDRPLGTLALAFGPQAVEGRVRAEAPIAADGHTGLDADHEPHARRTRFANFEAPGTVVLVGIFLAWFILMYLLAHFNISRVWPVG